jgi:ABC-type multidrug transport system, ATPase and permease components
VSFLRAIVRKPKIIILDEATSQLDPFTESRLQKALFKALSGRTSIIIAHRLSTVKTCDFVIYIDNGKVVEMGPPSKLVNSDGRFAKMLKAFSDSSAF